MALALEEAQLALQTGDVPVGCVITDADGRIIGRGHNRREANRNALSHAEMEAISMACREVGSWRLQGCTLYVTLEPCPMCAGAILNARIPHICYAAKDEKAGACGSVLNLFEEQFGHHPTIRRGPFQQESAALLRDFFSSLRISDADFPS